MSKVKNCVRRLRIESQIAHRGYMTWEDVMSLLEVFPLFSEMYFQYNGESLKELHLRMSEDEYTISYESYVEMFMDLIHHVECFEKDVYREIMFE